MGTVVIQTTDDRGLEENLVMKAERKGEILKKTWKTGGCASMGPEPQSSLGCGSGRQHKICCLWEKCERTKRGGGEEKAQGFSGGQTGCHLVSAKYQMSM